MYIYYIHIKAFLISLPYWISAGLTPIFGYLIDRIGKRPYIILTSSIVIFLAHTLFFVLPDCSSPRK